MGNRIREWRERRQMTIEELADAAGLSAGYLSRMENGKRNVSLKNLAKIARPLAVADSDLIDAAPGPSPRKLQLTDAQGSLAFAAVDEAFLRAGFSSDIAAKIAGAIQLALSALPTVPQGMTPEGVIRRIVRWELDQVLPQEPKEHP
jgi:transcriptional regulator with XRE-family HTH domain